MSDFLPVLLGSDANVYGMARSFYQQYGVRSVAICKGALVATSNTNLVKIAVLEPDLENDETFVKTLTDYAKAAIEHAGITPIVSPVRGGTDGARLSFKGLPCPNLGTGGHAFHGVFEHITVEGMDKAVLIVKDIIRQFAE